MRVKKSSIITAKELIDRLPATEKEKCSLCNDTLVHLIGQTMAKGKVPLQTACNLLADDINDKAAPADKVTAKQLRDRVDYHSKGKGKGKGKTDKLGKSEDKSKLGKSEDKTKLEKELDDLVNLINDCQTKIAELCQKDEKIYRLLPALITASMEYAEKKNFIYDD